MVRIQETAKISRSRRGKRRTRKRARGSLASGTSRGRLPPSNLQPPRARRASLDQARPARRFREAARHCRLQAGGTRLPRRPCRAFTRGLKVRRYTMRNPMPRRLRSRTDRATCDHRRRRLTRRLGLGTCKARNMCTRRQPCIHRCRLLHSTNRRTRLRHRTRRTLHLLRGTKERMARRRWHPQVHGLDRHRSHRLPCRQARPDRRTHKRNTGLPQSSERDETGRHRRHRLRT